MHSTGSTQWHGCRRATTTMLATSTQDHILHNTACNPLPPATQALLPPHHAGQLLVPLAQGALRLQQGVQLPSSMPVTRGAAAAAHRHGHGSSWASGEQRRAMVECVHSNAPHQGGRDGRVHACSLGVPAVKAPATVGQPQRKCWQAPASILLPSPSLLHRLRHHLAPGRAPLTNTHCSQAHSSAPTCCRPPARPAPAH